MALGDKPKRSLAPLVVVLVLLGLVAVGVALWAGRRVGGEPVITVTAPDAVGPRGEVAVVVDEPVRGVVDVVVTVEGAGLSPRTIGEVHHAPPTSAFAGPGTTHAEWRGSIGKNAFPELTAGTLTLRVTATRVGTWLSSPPPSTQEKTIEVRLTPPSVVAQSQFIHISQGGAEVVVYDVGPTSTFDGVVVERVTQAGPGSEPWVFPGSPLPGAPPTRHFAFFALPYDDDGPEDAAKQRIHLFAEDALGNRATSSGFVHKVFPRPMGKDTLTLKDSFLQKVTGEIYGQTPSLARKASPLDDYLQLNRDLRQANNAFLVELAKKSQPKFLWSKVFVPFDNAAIKGAFADRRTYVKEGAPAPVDTQDHLGFDLARVEKSPVNAGNDGGVLFASYLGIYGNCVVVDHGFGVMTLYAHLSSIAVKEGDVVVRGATLGNTGATGLAGGDHLHFTTLVHGRPTNPIEWWDAHWIGDRVKLKLGDSFAFDATDAGAATKHGGSRKPAHKAGSRKRR